MLAKPLALFSLRHSLKMGMSEDPWWLVLTTCMEIACKQKTAMSIQTSQVGLPMEIAEAFQLQSTTFADSTTCVASLSDGGSSIQRYQCLQKSTLVSGLCVSLDPVYLSSSPFAWTDGTHPGRSLRRCRREHPRLPFRHTQDPRPVLQL